MENKPMTEEMEIDVLKLINALWKRVWLILLCGVVCAALAFSYAYFIVVPQYSSSVEFYVNNSSGSSSLSSSQVAAAESLLKVYVVIMQSRETLDQVIEKAGLAYSPSQLKRMISAASVSNTEVFSVTVKSPNPDEARLIADTIMDVLPQRIDSVVSGSSVVVVSAPRTPSAPVEPIVRKYAMLGAAVGILLCCVLIIISELLDNTIRDADYLESTYGLPTLALIPDLEMKEKGGYYKKKTSKKTESNSNL